MTQDDQKSQALEILDRVVDASQAFRTQHVTRYADHEDLVGCLVEDPLDGSPRIRTAQKQCERRLLGRGVGEQWKPQR